MTMALSGVCQKRNKSPVPPSRFQSREYCEPVRCVSGTGSALAGIAAEPWQRVKAGGAEVKSQVIPLCLRCGRTRGGPVDDHKMSAIGEGIGTVVSQQRFQITDQHIAVTGAVAASRILNR